jgi:hypothetical protein
MALVIDLKVAGLSILDEAAASAGDVTTGKRVS